MVSQGRLGFGIFLCLCAAVITTGELAAQAQTSDNALDLSGILLHRHPWFCCAVAIAKTKCYAYTQANSPLKGLKGDNSLGLEGQMILRPRLGTFSLLFLFSACFLSWSLQAND